jgi:hypothetical protein
VFLATEAEVSRRFQGWARPEVLLPVLLELKPEYRQSYLDAQVAAAQWAVMTPPARSTDPTVPPPTPPGVPRPIPPGAILLAQIGASVAPFTDTGQLNDMAMEQFLALALGLYEADPVRISIAYLKGSYAAALHTEAVDRTWPAEQQTKAFLDSDAPYVAITMGGQYDGLLPRVAGLNSILRAVVERDRSASPA